MHCKKNTIQIPLSKARGLGSSHNGTHHHFMHGVTTLLNIPLLLWVIYSIYSLKTASYAEFTAYFAAPLNAIAGILFVMVVLYHLAHELQVVYEDYISCKFLRTLKIVGLKIFFFVLGLASILSILKIAL